MNEIAKKATADKFLKALEKENLSKAVAGMYIGLTPVQVSYLFNEKYWDRLGIIYWDKVLAWLNSGYTLKEYPKHHPEAAHAVADKILNEELPEHIAEGIPASDNEIMEPEFEEEVIHSPVNISDNVVIQMFIKQNASSVITAACQRYYYMPFWFKMRDDGKIEFFSFSNLPEDLKEAIKSMRGE